jgi:site-specific recombinase XerD
MNEALARFEQYLMRRFGQSSTSKHYLSDLNIFIRVIDNKAPEDVTPQDVDTFIDSQIATGLNPTTINRRLACLHSFFEYLASERPNYQWPNPVVHRRHHLKTGSRLPRDVPDSDVNKIFAVITDERDRAMFSLMVGAGLRVGEVAALRLNDVEAPSSPNQLAKLRVCGKGNKERVVWLTASLWHNLQAGLEARPAVDPDHVFLNWRGRPISVDGIQYRLKQYCRVAGVTLSCHRLRHTFGRRMAENGLPVDSLARLLGHSHLQTTQRYIDGADPTTRADFAVAMAKLETNLIRGQEPPPRSPPKPSPPPPPPQPRRPPESDLQKLRQKLHILPPWLAEATDFYLAWRWPTWRAQTAYVLGNNLISVVRRIWNWLATHRRITDWETFHRADLEAWLKARHQDGVSDVTIRNDLAQFRSLLRFLEARDCPLDPGLFRVQPPKQSSKPLPRYLTEADYRWLETNVLQATQSDNYDACFDQAWFLTLAHTGVRLSEMLDLRLGDLNLAGGYATVRGGKPGNDRVVYLTPQLMNALGRYLNKRPNLPDDDHVFLLRRRSPTPRTIQRRLANYGQQCDVQVSPHRLRHTMATRLVNQGMPILSLKKLLGHQHLNTTQLYARIYDETLYRQFKEAMSHLEAIEVDALPSPENGKHNLVGVTLEGGPSCLEESRRILTNLGQGELY